MSDETLPATSTTLVATAIAGLAGADCAAEAIFAKNVEIVKSEEYSYAGIYRDTETREVAFVKCYFPKGFIGCLLSRLGMTRADRAFRLTTRIDVGLPVARPLGFVTNRSSGRAYLFSPLVAGENLSELFKSERLAGEDLQEVLELAGRELARYHLAGWSHGDFKWGNILVLPQRAGLVRELCFIDLDGASHRASRAVRARDLARFIVNAEDYRVDESTMRSFIASYAEVSGKSIELILRQCRRPLAKLRRRHDRKYGLRTTALFDKQ